MNKLNKNRISLEDAIKLTEKIDNWTLTGPSESENVYGEKSITYIYEGSIDDKNVKFSCYRYGDNPKEKPSSEFYLLLINSEGKEIGMFSYDSAFFPEHRIIGVKESFKNIEQKVMGGK